MSGRAIHLSALAASVTRNTRSSVGSRLNGLVATLLLLCTFETIASADESIKFAVGPAVRKALEQPISGTWGGNEVNLRVILREIEGARHVAVVLDRRIDPTASLRADAGGEMLGDFLERLAAGSNSGSVLVGNTVYLGPAAAAAKLRTLVALRTQELSVKGEIPGGRRGELGRATTFRWNDLDSPADVLTRLAEQYQLKIEGLDLVPHDLWGGAVLPESSAAEALSLVLVQFDLTFAWIEHGKGVRLERVPERVEVERVHPPSPGTSASDSLAGWKEKLPDLDARVEKGKIVVTGTLEVHELVDRLRRGGDLPDKTASREGPPLKPLRFERYTLKMKNTPASALLKELGTPARGKLAFKYDPDVFQAAGIDLDKLVSFEVKNATIEELLKATFEPLHVQFEIVDRTVKLKPAK
jgi:hypothetical protein